MTFWQFLDNHWTSVEGVAAIGCMLLAIWVLDKVLR